MTKRGEAPVSLALNPPYGESRWREEVVAGGEVGEGWERPDVVSIDPGGVHCGVATFSWSEGAEWACTAAWELTPAGCLAYTRDLLTNGPWAGGSGRELLVETFQLYAGEAMSQVGSEFPTVQVIGVLKYLHAWYGHPGVAWVQQPASVQKPTERILRAKKVKSTALQTKAGPHAKSAELHGWYRILKGRQA